MCVRIAVIDRWQEDGSAGLAQLLTDIQGFTSASRSQIELYSRVIVGALVDLESLEKLTGFGKCIPEAAIRVERYFVGRDKEMLCRQMWSQL